MSDAPSEGANTREIAYRLFAAEYDDADLSYSEGEQERAPNYVVTPTGARVNRAFFVGVLTEVEAVSEDVLRARVVDPTGAFVLYAGQYQPDEQAFLEGAETPTFVAVTGKARTFQPDDSDRVYTSIRPEIINEVDADTRDRWTVGTAERTLQRVGRMARAIHSDRRGDDLETALVADGADEGFASGIVRALDHYGTSPAYLSAVADMALDAARLVAGDTDEVDTVSVPPDAAGEADTDSLAAYADLATVHAGESAGNTGESGSVEGDADTPMTASTDSGGNVAEPIAGAEPESTAESAGDAATVEEAEATPVASAGPDETGAEVDSLDETEADVDGPDEGNPAVGEPDDASESEVAGEAADPDEATADVGDFEPGEFDLDDEEREEIEAEFGTEFQSGAEVDEPGEADIETPDPEQSMGEDDTTASVVDATAESTDVEDSGPSTVEESVTAATGEDGESADSAGTTAEADGTASETGEGTEADGADDVDLEEATLDVMTELDDGAGADRGAVVEETAERHGVDPEAVEAAIQDALMDGRCYEPDDATLKPI